MSKLKILVAGDPVLRQKAAEVERMDKKTLRLLDDMAETMYAADGVGLAAPQIGVSKRISLTAKARLSVRKAACPYPITMVKWSVPRLCTANIMTARGTKCLSRRTGCWQSASSTSWTTWTVCCLLIRPKC